jgi:hypothetical protein
MRTTVNTHIKELWDAGGPFTGTEGRPHGRVTVEIGWLLRISGGSANVGDYHKGPIRWFQRQNNVQNETEVPNVKTIQTERSIDTDAATCTITMSNQMMRTNDTMSVGDVELGQPGFFTWGRGESTEAQARWNQVVNEWNEVLVPNALIRTYQGYGGNDKTIAQAVADGNIIQTGIWLVDEVDPKAGNQELEIKCRDMGKLVIEQSLYPPLVPKPQYPLNYYRWIDTNHPVVPYGTTVYGVGYTGSQAGQFSSADPTVVVVHATSAAPSFPAGFSCDYGDPSTYWLSDGHTDTHGWEYIEYNTDGTRTPEIGAFDLLPWGGSYIYYVSVRIGGVWQGTNTIPGPSGMNIPYVRRVTATAWEAAALHGIGPFPATGGGAVRFTFTNLARSSLGPQFYRCGIRDVSVGTFAGHISGGGRTIQGIVRPTGQDSSGYWLAGTDGGVFSFGTAKFWGSEGGKVLAAVITGIASKGDGTGYWLCGLDGGVFAFGDARYYGGAVGVTPAPIVGIERAAGGLGYYLVSLAGGLYAYGGATPYNTSSFTGLCVGMAASSTGGVWLLNSNGQVFSYGATYHGGAATSSARAIAPAPDGGGYYIVDSAGHVYAQGSANYRGGMSIALNDPISDIEVFDDNTGYWLVGEDGGVFTFSDGNSHNFWGSLPESFDLITEGNYADYSDIIKDILFWCGWWLYDPTISAVETSGSPAIFGNIESTGAFAQDNLREDFFDKKPAIDVIHTIKEIVGYLFYIDDQGGARFESPNIWSIGNFLDDGTPTALIPNIDEAIQMTDYTVGLSDKDAMSSITISSSDPDNKLSDTITTTIDSVSGQARLRGLVKNSLWTNEAFISPDEQSLLAQLVDLFSFMAERQGQLTCAANPTLCINDQVRIWERQTSDTYIHYIRGISTTMDLQSGEYFSTVTTHWLGDGTAWFLQY